MKEQMEKGKGGKQENWVGSRTTNIQAGRGWQNDLGEGGTMHMILWPWVNFWIKKNNEREGNLKLILIIIS